MCLKKIKLADYLEISVNSLVLSASIDVILLW